MSVYATLGDIEFETLTSPTSMDGTYVSNYAKQSRIGQKSTLQYTGDEPDDLSVSFYFHRSFCDPEEQVQRLQDLRNSHQAVSYVMANGTYRGTFVLSELGDSLQETASDGTYIAIQVSGKLIESVGDPAKPNPPGVLQGQPALPTDTTIEAPIPSTPSGLLGAVSRGIASIQKIGEASARVNDIVARANNGDVLGAIGIAGAYAPQLTEMAQALPVDALQDLSQVKDILIDAGQAAAPLAQAQTSISQASTLLQGASTLSGLSSASQAMQAAMASSGAALPALQRLEARAKVGSRLQGVL